MAGFSFAQGRAFGDHVELRDIAARAGTPVYVYSAALIRDRYRALDRAFTRHPHRLHYAIKANATTAVVALLRELGAGADANSGGEIEVALRAGFAPRDVVFTGVGKTRDDLTRAISLGVAAINAESPGEVGRIAEIAAALKTTASIAVRVNPDVEAGSHPHISTGHRSTKFGMSLADAAVLMRDVAARGSLKPVGLHVHVGSQVTRTDPLAQGARVIADLARALAADGIVIEHLDIGGGLGIAYEPGERVVDVADYADAILRAIEPSALTLVLEPGRWIVGPAGVLLTSVVDMKSQADAATFVVVDAGMTDLLRPALYGAWHEIQSAEPRTGTPVRADIVGPVCETSDTLGRDRTLPPTEVGDLLMIRDVGAYGSVMASNYNRRPSAAEVLIDGDSWRVIRRRQTIADLLQWDE
jgi:diaminopimelate decarboxylase